MQGHIMPSHAACISSQFSETLLPVPGIAVFLPGWIGGLDTAGAFTKQLKGWPPYTRNAIMFHVKQSWHVAPCYGLLLARYLLVKVHAFYGGSRPAFPLPSVSSLFLIIV